MSIPPELLSMIRRTTHDPSAQRGYAHLAGGFFWSDEFPEGFWEAVWRLQDWPDRRLIAHRASLILGENPGRFVQTWQEVEREAPEWPGFRPERSDPALAAELIAKRCEVDAGLEALDRMILSSKRNESEEIIPLFLMKAKNTNVSELDAVARSS